MIIFSWVSKACYRNIKAGKKVILKVEKN